MKLFVLENENLDSIWYPTYYLFKEKMRSLSSKEGIVSFNLGDVDVLIVLTDGEHAGQNFVDKGDLFIKNSSVKRFSISELDGFYITNEKNNQLKRSKLEKDDVLFTTIGIRNLGIPALVNEHVENANINQNVVRMQINKQKVTPQYLCCFLNSRIARFQVENLFTGNLYPILTYPKIKSLRIFLKDREIEKQITENLVKAEKYQTNALELITDAQIQLVQSLKIDFAAIKKEKVYSVPNEEVRDEDLWTPAYYYPLYIRTIKAIKEVTETEPMGELVNFIKGDEVGSSNYRGFFERKDTDVPFIRTSDFINFDVDLYPDNYIDESIYGEVNQKLGEGEVLMTKDGKIGLTAMLTRSDRCILGSGILRINAKEKRIDPYYLFIALSTREIGFFQAAQRTVVASTIPHLREDRVSTFEIPRVENEKEIASLAEEAFELKEKRKCLIKESLRILEESLRD